MHFPKVFVAFAEQADLLEERDFVIQSIELSAFNLSHINVSVDIKGGRSKVIFFA